MSVATEQVNVAGRNGNNNELSISGEGDLVYLLQQEKVAISAYNKKVVD